MKSFDTVTLIMTFALHWKLVHTFHDGPFAQFPDVTLLPVTH